MKNKKNQGVTEEGANDTRKRGNFQNQNCPNQTEREKRRTNDQGAQEKKRRPFPFFIVALGSLQTDLTSPQPFFAETSKMAASEPSSLSRLSAEDQTNKGKKLTTEGKTNSGERENDEAAAAAAAATSSSSFAWREVDFTLFTVDPSVEGPHNRRKHFADGGGGGNKRRVPRPIQYMGLAPPTPAQLDSEAFPSILGTANDCLRDNEAMKMADDNLPSSAPIATTTTTAMKSYFHPSHLFTARVTPFFHQGHTLYDIFSCSLRGQLEMLVYDHNLFVYNNLMSPIYGVVETQLNTTATTTTTTNNDNNNNETTASRLVSELRSVVLPQLANSKLTLQAAIHSSLGLVGAHLPLLRKNKQQAGGERVYLRRHTDDADYADDNNTKNDCQSAAEKEKVMNAKRDLLLDRSKAVCFGLWATLRALWVLEEVTSGKNRKEENVKEEQHVKNDSDSSSSSSSSSAYWRDAFTLEGLLDFMAEKRPQLFNVTIDRFVATAALNVPLQPTTAAATTMTATSKAKTATGEQKEEEDNDAKGKGSDKGGDEKNQVTVRQSSTAPAIAFEGEDFLREVHLFVAAEKSRSEHEGNGKLNGRAGNEGEGQTSSPAPAALFPMLQYFRTIIAIRKARGVTAGIQAYYDSKQQRDDGDRSSVSAAAPSSSPPRIPFYFCDLMLFTLIKCLTTNAYAEINKALEKQDEKGDGEVAGVSNDDATVVLVDDELKKEHNDDDETDESKQAGSGGEKDTTPAKKKRVVKEVDPEVLAKKVEIMETFLEKVTEFYEAC